MYELAIESQFDSAHNIRRHGGPCESLHGHTYRVQVFYKGSEINDIGVLLDFKKMKAALNDVIFYFDHHYLNELPEFRDANPTAECLSKEIFQKMRAALGEGVSKVTVWETATSSASYYETIDE